MWTVITVHFEVVASSFGTGLGVGRCVLLEDAWHLSGPHGTTEDSTRFQGFLGQITAGQLGDLVWICCLRYHF